MKVEVRPVPLEELATFEEAGACGTAAVISPIKRVVNNDTGEEIDICPDCKPGKMSKLLYDKLVAIQNGDAPDDFGWVDVLH